MGRPVSDGLARLFRASTIAGLPCPSLGGMPLLRQKSSDGAPCLCWGALPVLGALPLLGRFASAGAPWSAQHRQVTQAEAEGQGNPAIVFAPEQAE